jgi:uncharacterized protein YjbI with pentapeptide repeats
MKKKELWSVFPVFQIYAAFLAYFSLAVINISDRQIIITKTVSLPILNIEIGLNAFFITVPLIAAFFFVCFQLDLHKKKTVFDESRSALLKRSHEIINAFFLWGTLPLFLSLVAFKYVKTHEPVLSYVIGSAPIVGTLVVLGSLRKFGSLAQKKSFRRMVFPTLFVLSFIVLELFLWLFLIPCAREGLFPITFRRHAGGFLSNIAFVNLNNQELISEPNEGFKGSRLEGANLRHALLNRSDLKGAFLQRAKMQFAVLEGADLSLVNLLQTNFWNAELKNADLSQAHIFGASFREANLQRANLRGANLQYANFFLANCQEADLSLTDMQYANLWMVDFQGANFFQANLQGISLRKSNFTEADLGSANLQKANLWKADLRGTNFEGADLRGAEGLEIEQLAEVKTLYNARLDPVIRKQIEEKYPHLLRKPEGKSS